MVAPPQDLRIQENPSKNEKSRNYGFLFNLAKKHSKRRSWGWGGGASIYICIYTHVGLYIGLRLEAKYPRIRYLGFG